MKTSNIKLILPALLILFGAFAVNAQVLELPRKSPAAGVSYTLGYTSVSIGYGSPAVEGREIWGVVVPYGTLWRAGANEATLITFSTDVEIEGQALPAGKYSFFLIPRAEGNWTAIFNRDTSLWGAYGYDSAEDALRVEVEPKFARQANEERLNYSIVSQNLENGYIRLAWEKLRLYMRVSVEAIDPALLKIREAIEGGPQEEKWMVFGQAADFLLWIGQPGPAMKYAEQSILLKESSWNYWIKARIQAVQGKFAAAIATAEQARQASRANPEDDYYRNSKEAIDRIIENWKAKQ